MCVVRSLEIVASDLLRIKNIDRISAARLGMIIKQMEADSNFQERLNKHRSRNHKQGTEVQKWISQFDSGNRLYRLKVWYPVDAYPLRYRIIYAHLPSDEHSEDCYVILGVLSKDEFDYGTEKPAEQRVINDYNKLCGKASSIGDC